ncbi:MAG: hypothetical protein Q8K92_06105 [Leadbetterella sp.]|nr:hypothetical protein [Leadbetterella sp.]
MQNYSFEKDFQACVLQYPGLKSIKRNNIVYVNGFLNVINPETQKGYVTYNIEMEIPKNFPFAFPTVYEIGGKFPKNDPDNFHTNKNGDLCLDVEASEVLKTKQGLSLLRFITSELIPNLSWRYCVLYEIPFDRKEYKHGTPGIFEFYKKFLNENNIDFLLKTINSFLNSSTVPRKKTCFCNLSGTRLFKHCHKRKADCLYQIGKIQVSKDYNRMDSFIKNQESKAQNDYNSFYRGHIKH